MTGFASLTSDTLPRGIRARFIPGINGLRMHVLEAGFEGEAVPWFSFCTAFPRSPIPGER